jgi:polar amino acid transport system permease protein
MIPQKKQSLLKNKSVGHLIAVLFYIGLGYFLYSAAVNMNYIWQWKSVPQYFVYQEVKNIEATIDGTLIIKDDQYYIENTNETLLLENVTSDYKFDYEIGEDVYEGDLIATHEETKAGPILNGLSVTLKISFFAALVTISLAIIVAMMKLSSYVFLRDIATVFITIIRGTPLLVQIFLFYFIVANIFELDRFVAGFLSLGIFYAAYMAEVLRGAIQSIDKGQMEAAKSLGISHFQAMRHIILPQAIKRALPTLIGEIISLVKDSSLVSIIAITDLTKVGREIVSNTFAPFETWIVIALVYLCLTFTLSYIGSRIEENMAAKGGMS